MAVHEVTVARSGAGKTYFRGAHFVVTEWLPFPHNRNLFTNLPLTVDAIIEYMRAHHPEIALGDQPTDASPRGIDRLRLFGADVTDAWLSEKSGPWDYFASADMDAGRIIIDEIHNYVHTSSSKDYVQKWRRWLGEIRHCGCTFEGISQYETKVHPLIRHEAGLIRRLISSDDKRDPIFWVRYYEHFQLISKLKGYWTSRIWFSEFTENNGKWERTGGGSVALIPKFYRLYNSYSAPIAGGGHGAKLNPHPYGRMTWPELLAWYFGRNIARIIFFATFYVFAAWLFCFGGIIYVFNQVTAEVTAQASQSATPAQAATPTPTTPSPEKGADASNIIAPKPPPRIAAIWSPRGTFDQHGQPWTGDEVAKPSRLVSTPPAPAPASSPPSVSAHAAGVPVLGVPALVVRPDRPADGSRP